MVQATRSEVRRLDAVQNRTYKRSLIAIIFLVVTLVMTTLTLMNPGFMKGIARTSSGQAVIDRQINAKFDRLAVLLNGKKDGNTNLLTSSQTSALADELTDYTLGIHWFKTDNTALAKQLLRTIKSEVNDESTTEAQNIRDGLKKQGDSAVYTVITAFYLSDVTQKANLDTMFLIINVVLIIVLILSFISILLEMNDKLSKRAIIHEVTASGMWTGALMMILFVLLAMIPLIFNVEAITILDLGYEIELASSVFLEYVMVGAIIFIISTIPWQLSSAK